jgi:signal transduction histidine kinase
MIERKSLMAGFCGTALFIVGLSGFSYHNSTHLLESIEQSQQTNAMIRHLNSLFANMTVAESGRRGYVFLGDRNELGRYHQALQQLPVELAAVQQHLTPEPRQRHQFDQLETLLNRRVALLQDSIALHQQNPTALTEQRRITSQSVKLREQIQHLITTLQDNEEQALTQWVQRSQADIRQRFWLECLVALVGLMGLWVVYHLLQQQQQDRYQTRLIQQNLAQQNELSNLKLNFFSMVSHEFRTPLSVILGSVQLAQTYLDQGHPPEKMQKNIQRIQTAATQMTDLLCNVLTLSRAEVGKLEYNPTLVDVECFCLNLVEDLQLTNGRTIRFCSQGNCFHRLLDEKLLYSILSNLMTNAVRYSTLEQAITLTLRCTTEATCFQVHNQGCSIPLADQPYLYEPFYRGQNGEKISGTGLGLAIVKTCVELHQGHIHLESTPETGTLFTVTLPTPSSQLISN